MGRAWWSTETRDQIGSRQLSSISRRWGEGEHSCIVNNFTKKKLFDIHEIIDNITNINGMHDFSHFMYMMKFVGCEALNLINVLGQMYFMDRWATILGLMSVLYLYLYTFVFAWCPISICGQWDIYFQIFGGRVLHIWSKSESSHAIL